MSSVLTCFFRRTSIFIQGCKKIAATSCVVALTAPNAFAQSWPTVPLPKGVQIVDVGGQISINGLPARIKGFITDDKMEAVTDWFRRSLGKHVVENSLDGKNILGRAEGDYYLTVQLERAGTGTRGIVAVMNLLAGRDASAANQESIRKWLSRLPPGSRLVSEVVSHDGNRFSRHLTFANTYSEAVNQERIQRMMVDEGFLLEQESSVSNQDFPDSARHARSGRILFFKGNGKEAMATIHRTGSGETYMVLNLVNAIERFR